jgi:hypothetical protein
MLNALCASAPLGSQLSLTFLPSTKLFMKYGNPRRWFSSNISFDRWGTVMQRVSGQINIKCDLLKAEKGLIQHPHALQASLSQWWSHDIGCSREPAGHFCWCFSNLNFLLSWDHDRLTCYCKEIIDRLPYTFFSGSVNDEIVHSHRPVSQPRYWP